MARLQDHLSTQKGPRAPAQRDQATQSQSVKKVPVLRRSERISQLRRSLDGRKPEKRHASLLAEEIQPLPLPPKRQKRLQVVEDPANDVPIGRPRPSPFSPSRKQTFDQRTANGLSASQQIYIRHWAEQKTWPKEYFKMNRIHHLIAIQKSSTSSRRKRSEASLTPVTPSDQKPREEKSAPYKNANYLNLLEKLGNSYMDESKLGLTDASRALIEDLLGTEYTTPKETLFRDDVFDTACRKLRDQNEARVILDFTRLLAPSPESLATFGATEFDVLVESVNAGWNNSIPITQPRPQPDFSVGFRESMFSGNQLSKIQALLGDTLSLSYFRATHNMYFPFLTCEVKCGVIGLEIADRQNAHSMTLAVRGIVELFKMVKREKELHRELQTFSISHDHRTVRLYGYYPVFDGPETKIYRHQIHAFDITALNGKEKWTTYKFTVAVYYHSLTLLERIRSLIDDLPPDFDPERSQLSEPQPSQPQPSEPSRLSQQLENQMLAEVPDS